MLLYLPHLRVFKEQCGNSMSRWYCHYTQKKFNEYMIFSYSCSSAYQIHFHHFISILLKFLLIDLINMIFNFDHFFWWLQQISKSKYFSFFLDLVCTIFIQTDLLHSLNVISSCALFFQEKNACNSAFQVGHACDRCINVSQGSTDKLLQIGFVIFFRFDFQIGK